jgi:hypothetical protein
LSAATSRLPLHAHSSDRSTECVASRRVTTSTLTFQIYTAWSGGFADVQPDRFATVPQAEVTLMTRKGVIAGTGSPDAHGHVAFAGAAPGDYTLLVRLPSGQATSQSVRLVARDAGPALTTAIVVSPTFPCWPSCTQLSGDVPLTRPLACLTASPKK